MYLFPLVGFFIGLIICLFVYFVSIYLSDAIFLGLLICMFILFVTGLHHTDALADVADGLMVHGDKEIRKCAYTDLNIFSSDGMPRKGAVGSAICNDTIANRPS